MGYRGVHETWDLGMSWDTGRFMKMRFSNQLGYRGIHETWDLVIRWDTGGFRNMRFSN